MKLVAPTPSDVSSSVVGIALVDQQTPFAVIEEPPSEVIVPPDEDVVNEISDITTVVSVGTSSAFVVSVT